MGLYSYNKRIVRLAILIIVVVSAVTFTAFADSTEDSAVSEGMPLTDHEHMNFPTSDYDSNGIEISSAVTSRDPQGFIWMDMESIRDEIDTLVINRYDENINSESYTIPAVYFDTEKFFEIMEIAKNYSWTEHREHMNADQLKACQLTVIGHDSVYTYLVFGRDESGKCFIWSFYDYKIAYPSDQDFAYMEQLLAE